MTTNTVALAGVSSARLYWSTTAGAAFGYMSVYVMPVLAGPLVDTFGFDDRGIGILFTIELLGLALSSIFIAFRTRTLNLRSVGITGAILACTGQLLSMGADSVNFLAGARFLAGIGEGAAMAAAYAAVARSTMPEKAFAVSLLLVTASAVVLLYSIPQLTAIWGLRAGFGALLTLLVLVSPGFLMLPTSAVDNPDDDTGQAPSHFPYRTLGVMALLAFVLVSLADLGVWAFAGRIGTNLEIPPQQIGEILALSQIFGIGGGLAAAYVQVKYGRVLPFTVGLLLIACLYLGLTGAASKSIYTLCLLLLGVSTLFIYPYFTGLLAALDHAGSWTALAGSAAAIGMTLGPLTAGYLAAEYSYRLMGGLMSGAIILALLLVLGVLKLFPGESR